MKLFVLTNSLEKGGAEKLLVSCLPLFVKKGIQVELVLLNAARSVPEFIAEVADAGIPIHDLGLANIYNPVAIQKIYSLLKRNTPDVLHVHLFPSLYWAGIAAKLTSKKPALIYTEHSNHNKRRDRSYLKAVERPVYGLYDQLIAITDSVRDKLGQWIGSNERIVTILNGVDIHSIDNVPRTDRSIICSEFNLPKDAKIIFMAASFRYPKDQLTLIQAVKDIGPGYHLLLAGEGPLLSSVKAEVKNLSVNDRVHFLGFRTDATRIMKSVDLNVLSSHYEGMSGVTLESLASSVAFLGSDIPGIQEIVPDERFLFRKADHLDLTKKMLTILTDTATDLSMRESAKSYVQQFDLNFMADQYLHIYKLRLTRKVSS